MRRWVTVLVALSGCTYPEKQFAGPFTCLGAAAPTSAQPLVMIEGQAINPSDLMPLSGVSLTLQDRNMNTVAGPLTTMNTGAFQFSLNTNGTPVDGVYVHATAADRYTTYYAPARLVTENLQFGFALLSTMQANNLALGALGGPFTANTGAVLLTVNDCNDEPLANATVTSVPPGAVRYFDGIMPSMTATKTDAGGVAMVANLQPGPVTLTVTIGDRTLPSRTFNIVATAFVQTVIVP